MEALPLNLPPVTPSPDANEFWRFFNEVAAPQLAHREDTFRKIFQYLDTCPAPITIVETGCVRLAGNWSGDGQSTILFDKYVTARGSNSKVHSVDINAAHVDACRELVGPNVIVTVADSVAYLNVLTRQLKDHAVKINLLYLDSFDLDEVYWFASASHHLKELLSAWRSVDKETLVVVDDCPLNVKLVRPNANQYTVYGEPSVGGKGRLIAEFAHQVGVAPLFTGYQAGWVGLQF